jgi:integrase/recombinase XerD
MARAFTGFFVLRGFAGGASAATRDFWPKRKESLAVKRKQRTAEKPPIRVAEAFAQFQRGNAIKNLSPGTIAYYAAHGGRFVRYLDEGTMPVALVSADVVDGYVLHLKNKGSLADTTINTELRAVRAFLYYCMRKDWLERYPIPMIRATDPIKEPYTIQELDRLLEKPDVKQCSFAAYRNWVIVNFLLATGCRAATLLAVRIEDVNLDTGTVFFRHIKTRTQQVVPLSRTLTAILKEYLEYRDGVPEDALFVTEYGKPMCLSTLENAIRVYNLARGVDKTSLHLFRHTYAQFYIKAGGDPFRLQKLLGHSDLTMTRRYVALYADDLKESYDRLNPLEQMAARTRRGEKKRMY